MRYVSLPHFFLNVILVLDEAQDDSAELVLGKLFIKAAFPVSPRNLIFLDGGKHHLSLNGRDATIEHLVELVVALSDVSTLLNVHVAVAADPDKYGHPLQNVK